MNTTQTVEIQPVDRLARALVQAARWHKAMDTRSRLLWGRGIEDIGNSPIGQCWGWYTTLVERD